MLCAQSSACPLRQLCHPQAACRLANLNLPVVALRSSVARLVLEWRPHCGLAQRTLAVVGQVRESTVDRKPSSGDNARRLARALSSLAHSAVDLPPTQRLFANVPTLQPLASTALRSPQHTCGCVQIIHARQSRQVEVSGRDALSQASASVNTEKVLGACAPANKAPHPDTTTYISPASSRQHLTAR